MFLHTVFQVVGEKVRYVVGTFQLALSCRDSSNQSDVMINIDEKSDAILSSLGFSSEHKNWIDIKEKEGMAVEFLCPATPVRT